MYVREVDNQALTLVVSGLLWNRSLVMMDEETNSLWSHLLGEAKHGQLKGKELEALPGIITDWSTWHAAHPDTTVVILSRTANEYRREIYRDPVNFVLGMSQSTDAKAWPYDQLQQQPVVNDEFAGVPVAVFFDVSSATAFAYDRRVGDRVLTFQWNGDDIRDEETGTVWNAATGRAISLPLQDQRLKPVVGVVSYRHTWETFYPSTTFWSAK